MTINPIHTQKEYEQALKRLEKIFDALPNTKEGDELEILNRMRKLSLEMIRTLHKKLHIPPEALVKAY